MKADSLQMQEVFSSGGKVHYVLPYFQREYAWEEAEWRTLLTDVFNVYDLYDPHQPPEHFMGMLVVINDGTQAGTLPVFRLVDGQQRLTTVSLLLCAFRKLLSEEEDNDEDEDELQVSEETADREEEPVSYKEELHHELNEMLINRFKKNVLRYKLLPTKKYGDRDSYCAIVDGREPPEGVDSNIPGAYSYLYEQLASRFGNDGIDPEQFFTVLMTCLQVVFVNLNNNERPYEIFESLNYKGKSLTQADLVRNYIAMKLPTERQESAFNELWSPIEETLLEKRTVGRSRLGELTAFLRHYFAFLSGKIINQDHVYSRFRDFGENLTIDEFEIELEKLKRFAMYYDRMLRPEQEPDNKLREQLIRLNRWESSTAYPFILYMYDACNRGELNKEDMVRGLVVLETLMVRRFFVRDSYQDLNRRLPAMLKDIQLDAFESSLKKALWTNREPSDTRLRQSAERTSLYRSSQYVRERLALILETINRYLSRENGAYTVLDAAATIEHIMPQNLSQEWRLQLGANLQEDYDLVHTIGNLTLVTQEWNSVLSNALFDKKRVKLASHGLSLNADYFNASSPAEWNGDAIRERAQWLMAVAAVLWPQLGETAAGWKEVPRQVVIVGDVFPVSSWRDVLRRTAEFAVDWCGDRFEEMVVVDQPRYFSMHEFGGAPYLLPNGWWINVNMSADWIKAVSEGIIESAEIPDEEFEIVLW